MSEEQVQSVQQPMSKADLVAALQTDFATSVTKVYVNSEDKEYSFREISVKEQKSLTRIMQINAKRKDIIYDAQCALLNQAALDKSFDVYRLSEYDRLKLMIAIYQSNMFQNEVKFTCEECGAENKYTLDFENTLKRLDDFDIKPQELSYENRNLKYKFLIQYPTVRTVSKFHESYCRIHNKNVPRREVASDESMQNMEYINLFIQTVDIENKVNGKKTFIDFNNYKPSDREDIVNTFPQDVLYSDDGVIKFIITKFIQPMNDAFDKHECWNCHTVHEKENSNQADIFF